MATLSPFVYWGQKKNILTLKVDLRNVENVEVSLTEDSLDFTADGLGVKGLNKYNFHLDFYLPVDPEKSQYRNTALSIEFQIEKTADDSWPRLTSERIKMPWLKIDFDKFHVDDSDEEEEAQDALINKITTEIRPKKSSKKEEKITMSITKNYLFLYNLFQCVGFTYIFTSLVYRFIKDGDSAKQEAFEAVGAQLMTCQVFAVLEVIHPLVGLVRANWVMSFFQVVGRNLVLFLVVFQEPRLQISPVCFYLFLVWSFIEVIRYPFYLMQIVGFEVKFLTWLRYTVWIPLYPLGILIEGATIITAIPHFAETGALSLTMPNSYNMAFYFPYFLMAYLLLMTIGGTTNLKHMKSQRQKQLYGKSKLKSS